MLKHGDAKILEHRVEKSSEIFEGLVPDLAEYFVQKFLKFYDNLNHGRVGNTEIGFKKRVTFLKKSKYIRRKLTPNLQ